MNELIICEKRKAAEAIANAIGIPDKLSFNKLFYYYIKDKNIYVVPLRGHIKEYRNTDKYKSWTKTDPRDILTNSDSIFKFPSTYANNYIRLLAFISKKLNINSCIIGTDADVEGCNIGLVDAYSVVKNSKNITKISQLWLSSLQKQDIIRAYNNQIQPKWSWAYAGEARAIIDAIIGFSATREVSLTLKSLTKKANVQFVSIGRVQTCLLYLIFLRETQIRNFIPKPFWVINAIVENNGFKYVCPNLKNPIQDKKTAENVFNKIQNERIGFIKNKNSRTVLKYPPTPLNTSKALQLIIKHSNVTAMHALKIMEDLYLNQLITYPRTDTDKYKESFNHKENITQFLTHTDYGDFSRFLINKNKTIPNQGKKDAQDHPPITTIKSVDLTDKIFPSQLHSKVYDLLARYYLSLFSSPGKAIKTKCIFSVGNEDFVLKNAVLIEKGPYEIAPFLMQKYNPPLKLPDKHNNLDIKSIELDDRETKPPPRYTDNSLIKLMETQKIGTKSTRPGMIQLLIDRKYIEREKKSVRLTELGYVLIDNLKDIWLEFLQPSFTAYVENYLEQIKEGKIDWKFVSEKIKLEFLNLFDKFRKRKPIFLKKFEDSQISIQANIRQETKSLCSVCKKAPMVVIRTKKKTRFLACKSEDCKTTFALPQRGTISILKNANCQKCGFNVFRIKTSKKGKYFDYHLCPLCWNYGLKEKIDGYGFCSKCENFEIKNGQCIKK